jgi:hypothetical protein
MSALIFEDIRSRWAGTLDPDRLSALETDLRTMAPGETFRLDVPGWFGGWMATVTFAAAAIRSPSGVTRFCRGIARALLSRFG